MLATRRLLPKPTEDEQLLARDRLNSVRRGPIEGRQAYFAALARHAGGKRRWDPGGVPTTRAISKVHVGVVYQKGASERVDWEKEANRMAPFRKKNMSDALDETLRLREWIAQRVADQRQMSMA